MSDYIIDTSWTAKQNIQIKHCQFKSATSSTTTLVYIKNCNDTHIMYCKFDGGYDSGLSLVQCERSSITHCAVTNAAHQAAGGGIVVQNFGGIISDNVAYNNQCVGIAAVLCGEYLPETYWEECIISNNVCYNNGTGDRMYPGHGIRVDKSNRVIVSGNQCYYNDQYGILAYGSKNTLIANNMCWKNNRNGIVPHGYEKSVYGDQARLEESDIVIGNICTDNYYFGIGLWNAQKCFVTNNIISNNGAAGIAENEDVANTTDNNLIKDNDLRYQAIQPIMKKGLNTIISQNYGYATENKGAVQISDGGTIAHNLAATPTSVHVTPSVAGELLSVTAISSTTFTVAIKKPDGSSGIPQTIYWEAEV